MSIGSCNSSESNFIGTMYALPKDGLFGSACLRPGGSYAFAGPGGSGVDKSVVVFG